MPAVIAVTNLTPYRGNYQSFQTLLLSAPSEGPRTTPISFLWVSDAVAPDYAVNVNLAAAPIKPITQIASLYVDNLTNDADVSFYFPDTGFRLDVPANTVGLFPVITNGLQFNAYCPSANDGDMTFVQILNFNPPPVAVEKTQFLTPEVSGAINLPHNNVPTNTTIFAGSGTLRGLDIRVAFAVASATDTMLVKLFDGVGGPILYSTAFSIPAATTTDIMLVPLVTGLDIPIVNGLVVNLSDPAGLFTGGGIFVNAYVSHK